MTSKPLNNILVKPAGPDCNMACAYCFYRGKNHLFSGAKTHRMTDGVLEIILRQLMEQPGEDVNIGWQGGEPTLMGLPFFERAVALEEKYGGNKSVGNGFQTNGLLLDKKWARFFQKYKFLIGLSIDGPQMVHDHYRRLRGGSPSWERVSASARMLLDNGVSVNAVTVVNNHSARFPEEIYEGLKTLNLTYMQFIPCVETNPGNRTRIAPYSVSADAYGTFLCKIFDLWRADFIAGIPSTSVRFFESLLFSYAGFSAPECTLRETCGDYIVIEHNGDVFSCDFFVESEWRLGNVMDCSLVDMLNSPKQKTFGAMKTKLHPECLSCQWLAKCRGGCVKNRLCSTVQEEKNYLCNAYKNFFAHADGELNKLVAGWREKTAVRTPMPGPRLESVGRNEPCPCGSGRKYKKCCGK
jgi:uncharacterized protein